MGDPVDDIGLADIGLLKGGIARKKWIDQDAACAKLDTKTRMAEPSYLHTHTLMRHGDYG